MLLLGQQLRRWPITPVPHFSCVGGAMRRIEDDLSVAIECNTEGWPDGPEAWAQVLSWVWDAEMYHRKQEEMVHGTTRVKTE